MLPDPFKSFDVTIGELGLAICCPVQTPRLPSSGPDLSVMTGNVINNHIHLVSRGYARVALTSAMS